MRTTCYLFAAGLLALAGCATSADVPTVFSQPLDSAVRHQVQQAQLNALPLLGSGRLKFNGPVTIQLGGTGNVATTTDATRAKAPVAAAPDATASSTQATNGPPWYVYLLGAGLLVGLGGWVAYKLSR